MPQDYHSRLDLCYYLRVRANQVHGFIRRVKKRKQPRKPPPPRPSQVKTVIEITVAGGLGSVNFGDGSVPTIAVINKATGNLGANFDAIIKALGRYANEDIAKVWGTPANFIEATEIPAGAWAIVFSDTSNVAGALGYHDLTPEGLPLSHVFVETAKKAGEKPSVTAAHELVEMLVDPAIALAAQHPNGEFWAYETADPVQTDEYVIDGVSVSNFVYPSYFEAFRQGRPNEKYDHLGLLSGPFTLRPGGYMPIYRGNEWTQIFGSLETEERYRAGGLHGQRLHRRTHSLVKSK